jgi:cobalt/nickel transport system permease protein
LGPSLIFLATFVVNIILALFGHGGVTVIGLNTLTLSIEGILGYYLFRLFRKVLRRLTLATFLATFIALIFSTFAMIGVVSLGAPHYEELIHQDEGKGMIGFEFGKEKEGHQKEGIPEKEVNLKRFIAIILPLGFVGWVLEGVITALICRYIYRLRPDLLHLEKASP